MRTRKTAMGFFTRKKIAFSIGIVFLVILTVSFFAFDTLKVQKYDSVRINLSGRQRMLSQKMTKEILLYDFGGVNKDAVLSTVKVFDTTLIALKDGGDAPLDLSMTEFEAIPAIENKETKAQLEKVMSSWNTFKQKIESVLENNDASSMNYIIDNNTKLLDEMDAAVVMMQHDAEGKITRLYWIIGLGILVSVLIFIVAITKDITERKQMQQELEQKVAELQSAYQKLQELDQMKDNFLSTVSHELRTPLTSIKSFTEILLSYQEEDRETQREFLGIIHQESDHLGDLVNNLLDLSKLETGQMQWEDSELEIPWVIRTVVTAAEPLAARKNLRVDIDLEPDLPPVWDDRNRLVQVVTNLLSNAIKFTPEGGEIRLRAQVIKDSGARGDPDVIMVSVIDSGIGIAPEDYEKVFDKFRQVGDTLTDKPKGTGLGLAICREIVAHYGGRIWVESQLGKGSTFFFTLPIMEKVRELVG